MKRTVLHDFVHRIHIGPAIIEQVCREAIASIDRITIQAEIHFESSHRSAPNEPHFLGVGGRGGEWVGRLGGLGEERRHYGRRVLGRPGFSSFRAPVLSY